MPGYAKTVETIISDTLLLLSSYFQNSGNRWSPPELVDHFNQVVLETVLKTGILKDSRVIPIIVNTSVYTLPPECIRLLRVKLNGYGGTIVLPVSVQQRDLESIGRDAGNAGFYTDHVLKYNQIGITPTPNITGSTFTKDGLLLLRQIKDSHGNKLPYDANLALRDIQGQDFRFTRSGDGNIIREVISPFGNLYVSYVRVPSISGYKDYPDVGIPLYFHKEFKYGLASKLVMTDHTPAYGIQYIVNKWSSAVENLQYRNEYNAVKEIVPC